MRFRLPAATLALGFCLLSPVAVGQTTKDVPDERLFEVAYKAVDFLLPRGHRVVTIDDPLLRIPADRNQEVQQANGRFASLTGLSTAALKEVLLCNPSYDCSFKDDIVASASFRMVSRQQDSAVVYVATRSFLSRSAPQHPRWQVIALHAVYLARRNREWTVVGLSILAES